MTIQFGHNDMKIAPPESMGVNLTAMVKEVRNLGAEPVLVTSLTRRSFRANGTVADTLGPWAARKRLYTSFRCILIQVFALRDETDRPTARDEIVGLACQLHQIC